MVKATLVVLDPTSKQPKSGQENTVEVHFNPQSLRMSHHTTGSPGSNVSTQQSERQNGTAQQTGYAGSLSMELLFDTSENGDDVRKITLKILAMLKSDSKGKNSAPPSQLVKFQWGAFGFTGYIQSMDETLDLFSDQGVPLRATVSLSMTEVSLDPASPGGAGQGLGLSASVGFSAGASAGFSASASLNAGIAVGTTPLTLSQSGDTLQSLAGRAGISGSWQAVATANNIDNPRLMQPGTVLNLNASAQASAGVNTQ